MLDNYYLCDADEPIRLGISSCLLGEKVRYDGRHKQDHYITSTLGKYFEFEHFCPEIAIGLGVPRDPICLTKDGKGAIRVKGVKNKKQDITDELENYAQKIVVEARNISGYIFKSKSPSCGMEKVSVHDSCGEKYEDLHTPGAYAKVLMEQLPNLPVEDESRLNDQLFRENFIQRVFIYHRWQYMCNHGLTARDLVVFYTRHKYILMAHSEPMLKELGRLISKLSQDNLEQTAERYISLMMETLKEPASPERYVSVLYYLMSYVKGRLDKYDIAELNAAIEAYAHGEEPLIVPMTLLRHHINKSEVGYVEAQYFLNPDPKEVMINDAY